jgi:hypothetical protein
MYIRKMKAWLLTWKWYDSERSEKVVVIISSRRSEKYIREFVELLVMASEYNATDMAYFANKRRESQYQAKCPLNINGVPHGDRMICGNDPLLYARKVSSLKVKRDKKTGEEVLSWREPDDYESSNTKREVVIASQGIETTIRRPNESLIYNA